MAEIRGSSHIKVKLRAVNSGLKNSDLMRILSATDIDLDGL